MRSAGSFDIIVVGAGIAGLSSAYHFAKDGKRVVVIDQFDGKTNASFNSTAITSHDSDPDWEKVIARFGEDGAREFWNFFDLGFEVLTAYAHAVVPHFLIRRMPAYIFSTSPEEDSLVHEHYMLYKKIGVPVEFTKDGSALHKNFRALLTLPHEGESNNQAILRSLARSLRALGGTIVHKQRVEKLTHAGDGVEVVTSGGRTYSGQEVVIATGTNPSFMPSPIKTEARRTFVLSYERSPLEPLYRSSVLWDIQQPYHYLRGFRGKILWLGGSDVEESEYDEHKDYLTPLREFARGPLALDDSYKESGSWSGTFYNTPTTLPVIGRSSDSPIIFNYGFGDTGVLMSFFSGFLLASWAKGEHTQYQKFFDPNSA